MFTLSFLPAFVGALRHVRSTNMVDNHWTLIFLSLFLLYNLAESSLMAHNNLLWVLYVASVVSRDRVPIRATPGSSL